MGPMAEHLRDCAGSLRDHYTGVCAGHLDYQTRMYAADWLPNGLVRVRDRVTGLVGLYARDGGWRSGDLRYVPLRVIVSAVPESVAA